MQQLKTNMINEEWNRTQNDAPFVTFYDMHAVMFVLPDEITNVSIAGLVNTLASTNINQSAPNLVKIYMTIRFQMSSLMELIGLELSELSALELENLPYLTLYTL